MTLTTEHGSFEGETEAAVLAQARKAQRNAAKAEKQRQADADVASRAARCAGYRIYRAWHCRKPGQSLNGGRWDVVTLASSESARKVWWRVGVNDRQQWTLACECEGGSAILTWPSSCRPIALLYDAAGFLIGIFVQEDDDTVWPMAVGVHNGVVATEPIPGIDHTDLPIA